MLDRGYCIGKLSVHINHVHTIKQKCKIRFTADTLEMDVIAQENPHNKEKKRKILCTHRVHKVFSRLRGN